MATYDFDCANCQIAFEVERSVERVCDPALCPICDLPGVRRYTMPKLRFKPDPRDVAPVWHKHDGYAHSHAPGRGRHRTENEDH